MTPEEFDFIIDSQLNTCRDMLVTKAREYADDNDRLHNFKVAAVLQDITVAQALRGMMAKHTVSVYDMVNSGETYPLELWGEKITDHINYLLLLLAVVCEDNNESTDESSNNCVPKVRSFGMEEFWEKIFEKAVSSLEQIIKETDETNA